MASSIPVFLLLLAGLFTNIVGYDDCGFFKGNFLICGWLNTEFCCGTCEDRYCCDDPQKSISKVVKNCLLKNLTSLQRELNSFRSSGATRDYISIAVYASLIGVVVFIIVFIVCWVSPSCFLHKRFRIPRPVLSTTTFVTSQYLPQPVVQSSRCPPYQPLTNDPIDHPMPTGALHGPPSPYEDAAYPAGVQTMDPKQPAMPSDYTLPPPAFNPACVESPGTNLTTPVQMVKIGY